MWGIGRKVLGGGTSECGEYGEKVLEMEPVNVGNREKRCWEEEPLNV